MTNLSLLMDEAQGNYSTYIPFSQLCPFYRHWKYLQSRLAENSQSWDQNGATRTRQYGSRQPWGVSHLSYGCPSLWDLSALLRWPLTSLVGTAAVIPQHCSVFRVKGCVKTITGLHFEWKCRSFCCCCCFLVNLWCSALITTKWESSGRVMYIVLSILASSLVHKAF